MPIDPRRVPLTAEARSADRFAAHERRLARLERTTPGYNTANVAAAWQTATLVNGFGNFGSGRASASYYKDTFGRVYMRGLVSVAAGDDGLRPKTIFTLATGFRPAFVEDFVVAYPFADGIQTMGITVTTGGVVQLTYAGAAASGVPLNGISFRTI